MALRPHSSLPCPQMSHSMPTNVSLPCQKCRECLEDEEHRSTRGWLGYEEKFIRDAVSFKPTHHEFHSLCFQFPQHKQIKFCHYQRSIERAIRRRAAVLFYLCLFSTSCHVKTGSTRVLRYSQQEKKHSNLESEHSAVLQLVYAPLAGQALTACRAST